MSGDEPETFLWAVEAAHEPMSVGRFVSWSLGVQARHPNRTLAILPVMGAVVLVDPSVLRCPCWICVEANDKVIHGENYWLHRTFIVCPDCGDKRCPKAVHHGNPCAAAEAPA